MSRTWPSASDRLSEYRSPNIAAPEYRPRHGSSLSRGTTSVARTFSTRRPTSSSVALITQLGGETASFQVFRRDIEIAQILLPRIKQFVSKRRSTAVAYNEAWDRAVKVMDDEKTLMSAYDEESFTAAFLMRDGTRMNHFVREPSNFNNDEDYRGRHGGIPVSAKMESVTFRKSPRIGSGTADCTINQVEIEDKPELSGSRLAAIVQQAGTLNEDAEMVGIKVSCSGNTWRSDADISTSEMHVLIQVSVPSLAGQA